MISIRATKRCNIVPQWALQERHLIAEMKKSIPVFLQKYMGHNGRLRWGGTKQQHGRDDKDDFYEAFYNWPLLYVVAGGDELLKLSHDCWNSVTEQLTEMGMLEREFDLGADFFHQGEGLNFLYLLCLADPRNPGLIEKSKQFANFYTGADPLAQNYDPEQGIIRAPHTGSIGPLRGYRDGDPVPDWPAGMHVYGLPFDDLPGVETFDDLQDRAKAEQLGLAMEQRFGSGDIIANLGVTSLTTNAFLMTGDSGYREWTVEYTQTWYQRALENQGIIPDNIGPDGVVGSLLAGKWYGGLYGWSWPHGFYNIAQSTAIAGLNAFLLTGDDVSLRLPRTLLDYVYKMGSVRDVRSLVMSLPHHWAPRLGFSSTKEMLESETPVNAFVVPYRYKTTGWFDYQPIEPAIAISLWMASMNHLDRERVERLRANDTVDWLAVHGGRTKEDAGHEAPWYLFLQGTNPDYPSKVLGVALAQVTRRLEQIRLDTQDLMNVPDKEVHTLVHHWQQLNPVTMEALVQLVMGGPQHLYNGGILQTRVRYYDGESAKPGLPEDIAVLVTAIEVDVTALEMVHTGTQQLRSVLLQAGLFAQHMFTQVSYDVQESNWPGPPGSFMASDGTATRETHSCDSPHLKIVLPPGTHIRLELKTRLNVAEPRYCHPTIRAIQDAWLSDDLEGVSK